MTEKSFVELQKRAIQFRGEDWKLRQARLLKIKAWIETHEEDILKALKDDFNKSGFDSELSELLPTYQELNCAIRNLKAWVTSKVVYTPLFLIGHKSSIHFDNKGVVLIISPWNYPFMLSMVPLISAIAAGNTVVLKPSEHTPNVGQLLKKMSQDCFYANEVVCEFGGKEATLELLKYHFDHVFFTGSTEVGRIVAEICAKKLIPCTLELGGKSPLIVDKTARVNDLVDKTLWAKFLNRGQSCVAPDYVIAHKDVADVFIQKLELQSKKFDLADKSHIINKNHNDRLNGYLGTNLDFNKTTLYVKKIENSDDSLMQDEIFGPILPVLTYERSDEIFSIVEQHKNPLALYVFSEDKSFIKEVLKNCPSGGVGINSMIAHLGNHNLPFGGRGNSGWGDYHGYWGFLAFAHRRAVISNSYFRIFRKIVTPPYYQIKRQIVKIFKHLPF